MSDSTGNMLFYTDGVTVWNQNHTILLNGTGLLGEQSSTQAALIIQKPGSNHIYYIFTTTQAQRLYDWVFCYSELDIDLDGGLGGITTIKNVQLFEPIGEKITAVKHANNQDIWVITHDKFTNKYLTYAVTSAGVNLTPNIFTGGSIDNGIESVGVIFYSPNFGYLKASPDGTRIACAFSKANKVDVLDFNKATGQLTFRFTINQIINPYGIEFSPNNSLLYVSGYFNSVIRQYNLNLSTPAQIISNSYNFPNINPYSPWAMQLGPDEKIYVANVVGEYSDCIQNPNQLGYNSNYTTNAVSLNGASAWLGLPNFAPFYLIPSGIEHTGLCENDTTFFSFPNGNQADSVLWNFGDPASGILNFSNDLEPFHFYQNQGTYNVTVTYFQNGQSTTVDKPVTIFSIPNISLGPDTFFCNGTLLNLEIEGFNTGYTYTYSSGIFNSSFNSTPTFSTGLTGQHWLTAANSCGVSSDTIQVTEVFPPQQFSLYGDQALCEGTSYFIGTSPAVGNYLWQDGSTEPEYLLSEAGEYYVTVSNQCGSQSDTMLITAIIPPPTADLGNDTSICAGNWLIVYPEGNFEYFFWQPPGFPFAIYVTETSTYSMTAYNGCGAVTDTIHVIVDSLPPLPIDLGADQLLCEGQTLTLTIAQPEVDYLWQNGSVDSIFAVTQSGQYVGIATNGCGSESDTIFIQSIPLPEVSLGPDTVICNGNSVILTAIGIADNYTWQDGENGPTLLVNSSGTYTVFASNVCGSVSDQINVGYGFPTAAAIQQTNCGPVTINGITYSSSGDYTQLLENTSGCDSIISIEFERLIASNGIVNLETCESTAINGIIYNQSGTFNQVLTNNLGCDSTLTINLDILNLNAQIFQTDSLLFVNGNPTAVQWINCTTRQAISGATQPSFVPQATGNYAAVITVGECVDTSNCRQIIISTTPSKTITLCESIVISPNPTTGKIEFSFDKSSYAIQLFSATGALLYRGTGFAGTQQLDLSSLAPALYVLQVDECSFKVVKQ